VKNYKKWICFDFDGVIASYNGWKGFDVLGKPQIEVIKAIRKLKDMEYCITILTTRLDTPTIRKWLKDNEVPFDSINSNAHNPPNTSQKPIYHAIIDDRAINYKGQSMEKLVSEIDNLINKVKD
jgi:hydroxymethylpyrimidine pyrophosphatase-like HAD family hydrolase